MEYSIIAESYEKIEGVSKRLEMTDYLAELFQKTPADVIDKVIYLTQGKIAPDFKGIELGMAEKTVLQSIYEATGLKMSELESEWRILGDLGEVAHKALGMKKQTSLFSNELTVESIFENFRNIAGRTGSGSQDYKIKTLTKLLHDSEPLEGKYIIRTVTSKLRLGIADMTLIDALAQTFAERSNRDAVERAYNVSPDLGAIAKIMATEGLVGLEKVRISPGVPVRSMLAERLPSVEAIIEKLGGECALDYKYDGLRIQVHITGDDVLLYTRNLESVTDQFPDVVEAVRGSFKGKNAVVEGECVPVDVNTGAILPFQEVSHRRGRKYALDSAVDEYPVTLFLFDCLYSDGSEMLEASYLSRRERLQELFEESDRVKMSTMVVTGDSAEAQEFFDRAIEDGTEGLIAKSIKEDSYYRAGARGWQWIKLKRDYRADMADSADLVVVGAFAGQGRRAGTYGALLMAVYNQEDDMFETVTKLGSGFDDELLSRLPAILDGHKLDECHPRVNSKMAPDYWFAPVVVMEVIGAEITLSPIHTAAFGGIRENAGLAIRFPRFIGRFRDDKTPEEATTSKELLSMYRSQVK